MKRYRYFNCAGFQGIDEASDGDYVAYDDAKQLEQQNKEMLEMLKVAHDAGEYLGYHTDIDSPLHEQIGVLIAEIESQKEE